MKTWVKILIAFVGSGACGALTYSAGQYPVWSSVLAYFSLGISGAMAVLIQWPAPKES